MKVLSFIIYAKNFPEKLEELLFEIESAINKYKLFDKIEIIVADRSENNIIPEVALKFNCRLINCHAGIMNDALGKYVMFLYDDSEIPMKTIQSAVIFLENNHIDNLQLRRQVKVWDESECHSNSNV